MKKFALAVAWMTLAVFLGAASQAQNSRSEDTLSFVQPVEHSLHGITDIEVSAPADTSAVRFYVDDMQVSELTNEYALATKTMPIWHTFFSSNWAMAGSHKLRAVATTPRGTLTAFMPVTFPTGSISTMSLDGGWRFTSADDLPLSSMEGSTPAVVKPDFADTGWKTVAVPNSIDVVDQQWMRITGLLGAYRRTFDVPSEILKQELYLESQSCFWSCRYFVNGAEVGSSVGGYLPRRIRITQAVHAGQNSIAIIVDSRDSTMGIWNRLRYYYWNYSGLLQDISLEIFPPAAITEFRAQGAADGSLILFPSAENVTGHETKIPTALEIADGEGRVVLREERALLIPAQGGSVEPIHLTVKSPQKWDLEHPAQYTIRLKMRDSVLEEKTGFRDITIQNGDLLLNGKPVLGLQGFNRHGDYPGLGKSQPDELADREIKQLHDKGFRIFRPAHYPTTKAELDAADKYGMLVLEEINVTGLTGEQLKSAETLDFARSQLQRMIARDRSHPSVFGWSIGNENRTDQPGSEVYVRDVIAYGKTLDQSRPFTEVSAQLRHDICYSYMDFLAVNIYAGWYTDKISDVVPELDALTKYAGNKPMVITEYGAEGVPNRNGTGKGSEYYQALTVDEHNRLLRNRPHFLGKMYWTSTEFVVGPKWDGGNPDPVPPFHTKGLLTYFREPKLAWRVMFSPIEMEELAPIMVDGSFPEEKTIKIVLHNREQRPIQGRFLITAPAGATASINEQPFLLSPGGSTEVSFLLTIHEHVQKRNAYGMVRAVVDEDTEAMPELLQVHVPCAQEAASCNAK